MRRAARVLLTASSHEALLTRIVEVLREAVSADAYALWRERPSLRWDIMASHGLSDEYLRDSIPSNNRNDTLEHGLLTIGDVYAVDFLEDRRAVYEREGIRSILVIPLLLHDRHSATLTCYFRDVRSFTADELAAAEAIGDLASVAITTIELLDAQRSLIRESGNRAHALQRLNELGRTISGELDVERVVQAVTDVATELTGAQFGAFFYNVLDDAGESYMLYTIAGVPRQHFANFPMPRNTAVFAPTFNGEGTVISDNIQKDPRYGRNEPYFGMPKGHLPVVSYLAVPVISRSGEVLGGLFFGHAREAVFTREGARIVEALAAQAAIAMDNARLYDSVLRDRASLQRSEERYRSLSLASPTAQAICIMRADGTLDDDSLTWREITGQTAAEMRGRGWLEVVHPSDRASVERDFDDAIAGERIFEIEFRLRLADGSYKWFATKGVPIFNEDGSLREWVKTTTDVDQKRSTEEHLRFLSRANELFASSLEYETTLSNLTRAAVPALADWCTVDVAENGTYRRIAVAHVDPAKVQYAKELRERYPPDPETDSAAQVMRTGESILVSHVPDDLLRALAKDEERYAIAKELGLVSWMVVPLRSRDRAFGAVTFVSSDSKRRFTQLDLRHAEEFAFRAAQAIENAVLYREAQQANRAKDDFLATLSHELRTPMTAILGWSRLLTEGDLDAATQRTAADSILESARAQSAIIEDVLDMSRVISGKLQLDPQPVELGDVVDAAIRTVHHAAAARGVALSVRRLSRIAPITGDPNRLQQIVWNLLSNAIKFTPRGGEVIATIEEVQSMVRLTVADTGRGISPDFLPHIFEPFRQAENITTRVHGGLGLGLAIVRHLVELHGGTILASSEGEGRGAAFIVDFPVRAFEGVSPVFTQDVPPAAGAREFAEYPRLAGVHVLFVDDQPDARILVDTVLSRCGADVVVAASVTDAMMKIDRQRFDIVVSDIAMPEHDGFDLLARLRARGDQTPTIAMTAFGRPEDRARILAAGFSSYLKKPLEPLLLAREIRDVIERR